MSADGFALARRILGDIGRLYDELDDDGLGAMSRSALAIAQTAEILASHEAKQPRAEQPGAEQPGAVAISWAPAPNILGDRYIGGTVKTDAPTWDAEAIEATLRRAEAEGLRVRITWHPKAMADTGLTNERNWSLVEGKPYHDWEGGGVWELDDGLDSSWSFVIGESDGPLSLPGIIAAEIIDEPAAEPSELEPAEIETPPWAAPPGWERNGATLTRLAGNAGNARHRHRLAGNAGNARHKHCSASRDFIEFHRDLDSVWCAVRTSVVRGYLDSRLPCSEDGHQVGPVGDKEAIAYDSDCDVAIVEDAVLRSQIAWLDREGGR